jgi:hypothetical protein
LVSRHGNSLHWAAQNIRKSLRYVHWTGAHWPGDLDVASSLPALRQCLRADLTDVSGCHQGELPIQGIELELNPAFVACARDVTRRVL